MKGQTQKILVLKINQINKLVANNNGTHLERPNDLNLLSMLNIVKNTKVIQLAS